MGAAVPVDILSTRTAALQMEMRGVEPLSERSIF